MWAKVLPADPAKEAYLLELPNDQLQLIEYAAGIVNGYVKREFTQTLLEAFPSSPRVVMLVCEDGQNRKLPINEKASWYYPNDFGVKIRGNAILIGEVDTWTDGEHDRKFVDFPEKWRFIHEMETILAEAGNDYEKVHSQFDEYLLRSVDPDIRKMYEEARDSFKNWPTA